MQIVWITRVIACDIDRAEVLLKIDARKKLFNPCPQIKDSLCSAAMCFFQQKKNIIFVGIYFKQIFVFKCNENNPLFNCNWEQDLYL